MKKILSAVAALGLVAGVASTAAAVDFSVTGRYVVEGYYLSDANGAGLVLTPTTAAQVTDAQNNVTAATNALALATANFDTAPSTIAELNTVTAAQTALTAAQAAAATAQANREPGSDAYFVHTLKIAPVLKVNDKVKLVTDFWLADNNFWGTQEDVAGGSQGRALANDTSNDVEVWQAYIDYASPVGGLKIGRMLSGPFGTSFLDTIGHNDRIIWTPSMLASGPWSTVLKYQKGRDNDGMFGNNAAVTDQDQDYYEFDLFHKGESGLGFSRIAYTNDKSTANVDSQQYGITVGGTYKLATMYINAEVDYRFGEAETDGAANEVDRDALGAFLQAGTQMGALDVSGMYFYASGDDNANDFDSEAVGALGNEFEPYYIMTGSHAGIFNTELYTGAGTRADARTAGIHSFGVHANYAMSERLMLHGAAAYHMAADELAGYDDELGIEYNVGAAYKLLDNLTYEAHFGYLDTGDFFKGLNQAAEEESVFMASNHLTMTF